MDGFAIKASDTSGAAPSRPVFLKVVADIPAGSIPKLEIRPGEAARIMTGAVLPKGADAVVPVEHTDFNSRQAGVKAPEAILVYQETQFGENIRRFGDDIQAGDPVLSPGHRVRPQDAGLMSMLGISTVKVRRKPRIAIFSSGDELLSAGEHLKPGKIYDANMYTLVGMAQMCGAEVENLGIAPDRPEDVRSILHKAVQYQADLILSSAGVSVGALDFVRSIIEQEGKLEFWRVNMRPGKPFAFGHYMNIPFIGLPGNPVSAYVGFEVFVRSAIMKMQGSESLSRLKIQVILEEEINSDGRESYLRAIVTNHKGEFAARLTGHQSSGNLFSLVQANALLLIPSGVKSLPSGGRADAWLLDALE
jgi:molybdopterin molybdotransferase